jgi:hypothetical protein
MEGSREQPAVPRHSSFFLLLEYSISFLLTSQFEQEGFALIGMAFLIFLAAPTRAGLVATHSDYASGADFYRPPNSHSIRQIFRAFRHSLTCSSPGVKPEKKSLEDKAVSKFNTSGYRSESRQGYSKPVEWNWGFTDARRKDGKNQDAALLQFLFTCSVDSLVGLCYLCKQLGTGGRRRPVSSRVLDGPAGSGC